MNKLKLKRAEFYITNVCNFNCTGCNRFNNINFSGTQRWQDYKDIYKKWADILDLEDFAILGGEPMTNPDYLDWLSGISEYWPNATGQLTTNGYYLKPDNKEFYELLKKSNGRLELFIGLHNYQRREPMLSMLQQWLQGRIEIKRQGDLRDLPGFDENWARSYQKIKDESWPECNTSDDWKNLPEHVKFECEKIHNFSPDILAETRIGFKLTDSNGVVVHLTYENYFSQGSLIIPNDKKSLGFYHSDPIKAHNNCDFAKYKCYHFIKGKLYKCGPAALFPELDEQFLLTISDEDRNLIHSYQPGSIENLDHLEKFLQTIDNPIDQCKFCPEESHINEIFSSNKKTIMIQPKRLSVTKS